MNATKNKCAGSERQLHVRQQPFFASSMVFTTLGGVVELVVGAIAGAALYKEPAS